MIWRQWEFVLIEMSTNSSNIHISVVLSPSQQAYQSKRDDDVAQIPRRGSMIIIIIIVKSKRMT